ncbi:MAG TPA: RNA polymerase sigma factor [Lacipirellulaceae bacterium]|jgi:RNA polymerase sigma-70 factor (ECF subfamily)
MSALTAPWVRTLLMNTLTYPSGMEETRPVAMSDEGSNWAAELSADVRAATRGDGEAYSRIIGRYQQTIARRMHRFTRDPAAIEELVHDVFVEAYFGLNKYRGDAPLEHWLQRIATRVGYKYWEQKKRLKTVSYEEGLHEPMMAENAAADEATEEVEAALEKLPPRDRLVLTLLYLESRSVAEAADLAGWSQTMVKVQAYRARAKLRKLIEATNAAEIRKGESHGRD